MAVDPDAAKSIFLAAADIAALDQRAAYLDRACAGNATLRGRVEELLAAHFRSGPFMNRPLTPAAPGGETQAEAVPTALDAVQPYLAPPTRAGSLGRLAHYEVLAVLGAGGFGTVLKAFDERLHRVVAIKVLAPALAASGAARQRFLREVRAAAAVRNEHVVGIHHVEETPLPYLVMEYVAGQTLQEKVERGGALGVKEILRIGMQIALGLSAAHQQGLIHRDIKPANILLENGVERVKLTDFGLARAIDDASLTQSGVIAGTPAFMSPEQAEGQPLDHRSDLFSLGSTLYFMATGHPPFRAATTIAVLKRVCEDVPRPVRDANPDIPPWLSAAVDRLLAKKPDERLPSAQAVAELFAKYLAEVQLHGEVRGVAPAAPERILEMNASPSKIKCGCGTVLAVTAAHAGKTVACPKCAAKIVVPGAAPTNWFVARGRERLGPFAPAQLKQLIASGQLKPDDMVLREGEKQWVKASAVRGLFAAPAAAAPPPPPAPPPATRAPTPQRPSLGARFRRLPWKVQLGVVGGVLLALLILGFLATRGGKKADPDQQANLNSNKDGGSKDGGSKDGGKTPVKPAKKSLDLSFIHADASGAIVLHPRQALKAPLAQALPAAALDEMGKDFGVKTEQIEQVLFLVEPGSARPAPPSGGVGPGGFPPELIPSPGLVIRFSVPVANKALLGKLLVGKTETKKHKEREYLLGPVEEGMLGMATGGYTPDDRTVILAPEPMLLKMLDAGDAQSPLRQRLAQADANDDLILVFVVEPYRKAANFFAKLFQGMLPPPLDEAAKLPYKLTSLGLAVNLRTRTPLRLTIEADDEATAAAVEKLLQGGYEMAKAAAPSWEPLVNSPMIPKPIQKELAGLVEQFLTKLGLERKGTSVEFALSKPVAKAPLAVKAFKPLVPASGKKEIDLGGDVTDVAVGGAGRLLIYHLKAMNKLAVFDVGEGKVVKEIPTTNETAFFAAGARQLAVITDDKRRLDLWNLETLEKDKTAPLPASLVGAKIQQMCMGSASEGPIYFAMPLPEKRTEALDPAKMTLKPVQWQKFGPQNAWGPQHLRVSPDGRVLLGWGGGWAGLELARFQNGRQEEGFSGFRFSMGPFALPSPDGKLVFHPDSVVGPDLKDAKGPDGYLLPAREPGFFLALKGGTPPFGFGETRLPSVKQVAIYSDNRSQLLVVTDLAELAEGSVLPWEKTLHYYPRAGLVVTLGQKSKVVLRKLDLAERLEKDGVDYLFVFDEPARGKRGGELSHKLDIRSKKGGVTVKVVEAPEGLKVGADGQVSWTIPADFDGAEATVLLTIRDGSGQETQHQMRINVVDE